MKTLKVIPTVLLSCGFLSGCTTNPEYSFFGDERVNTSSANQLLDASFESFDDQRLLLLLTPHSTEDISDNSKLSDLQKEQILIRAFFAANNGKTTDRVGTIENDSIVKDKKNFQTIKYTHTTTLDNDGIEPTTSIQLVAAQKRRSQIQDHLIAASNQRCNLYKTYLSQMETKMDASFGIFTTILSAAGSIATGERTSQLLSASASASSGAHRVLSHAIFGEIATAVIVPSIDKNRKEILEEIYAKRDKTMTKYTIEAAISDAIYYHGACSLNAGINYAGLSVKNQNNIGVKEFIKTQRALLTARDLSRQYLLDESERYQSFSPVNKTASLVNQLKGNDSLLTALKADKDFDFKRLSPPLQNKVTTTQTEIKALKTAWDGKKSEIEQHNDTIRDAEFAYNHAPDAVKMDKLKQLQGEISKAKEFIKPLEDKAQQYSETILLIQQAVHSEKRKLLKAEGEAQH